MYTVHFEMLKEAFFDDFSYTDPEDLEKRGNWDVQEGTGRRPGNRTWGWSADNVVLMKDTEDPENTIVRLKAKTDGTGGENMTQSQIRYYEEKFGAGTYVARVWLYDNVMESEDPEGTGAWNAKDQALSTFFTINRIEGPKWKPYHESDFEYLFNGGWGMGPKTMWFTSWNSYSLETSSEAQRDQSSSTGPSAVGSLDGRWSILTIKLDEDGRTTYYIDGQQKASHANKDEIAGPQSIAFNLWFIGGGQDSKYNGHSRTYWEDVDWVYYTPDTNTTTAEVEEIVTGMKNADIHVFDDIASPDITLNSITVDGQALEGFNNENTEYFIELPEGTKKAPRVEAKANNQFSIVTVTSPETLPGATTVYVTSSDLSVTKTYHLNFSVKGNSELAAPLSNFASGSMVKYRDVQLFHPQNADIYYTMDGSTPTTASRKYGGETIRIEESTNIKAIAAADGKTSPVADFLYTVIPLTPQVVAHPDAAINGSSIMKNGKLDTTKLTYDDPVTLELSMPESKQRFYEVPGRTDNYQFYYTIDGSLPTVDQYHPNPSTRLYEGPIEINKTTTVNFIAVLPGVCESYESTQALRSQYSQVKITINNPVEDGFKITIADTPGGSVQANTKIARKGDVITLTVKPDEGFQLKEGSLKFNGQVITGNSFVMPDENVTITAEFEKAMTADGKLNLNIYRTPDNTVRLSWTAQENAAGYNVYDLPYGGAMSKKNTELLKETQYVLTELDLNKVHTLTVKAVDKDGNEFGTANVRNVGITENIDVKNEGVNSLESKKDSLKLPVGDLAESLEYLGPTIQDEQYHYWCYTSIRDEEGLYHVFMSRVPRDIQFAPGWKTNSEIVHFVGEGPEGPFTEVGTPFSPTTLPDGQMSAHNPRIKYIDGHYVLLYIVRYDYKDNTNQGTQKTCMAIIDDLPTGAGTDTIDQWNLVNGNGVVLEYGFKAVNPDMLKVEGKTDAEDEYILLFKGNADANIEKQPYYLYYATSNKLEGPYTVQGKYTDAATTIEDPSVFEWKDKYFMLTYDLGNGISGAGQSVGMMIPSRDPHFFSFKDAQITSGMLNDYVKLPSGYTGSYSGTVRIERPYLVFENGEPTYFTGTNSVDLNGNNVAQSYTFKINDLPEHQVSVDDKMKNGTIHLENDITQAEQFDDVYFEVRPETGFVLVEDSIKIYGTDALGRPCSPEVERVNGKLCFIMPAGDVTVTAEFKSGEPVTIDSVKITPEKISLYPGATQQFIAEVKGSNNAEGSVTWKLENASSQTTTISKDGFLTIAKDEKAKDLVIRASSKEDSSKFAVANIAIAENLALDLTEDHYLASSYHRNNPGTVICYPKNAFDGNYGTGLNDIWTPKVDDQNPWIGVEFDEEVTLNTLIITERYNAGAFLKELTVEVSDDGVTWKSVQKFNIDNSSAGTQSKTMEIKLDVPATGKYMRIANLASDDPTSGNPTFSHVMEIEIYNLLTEEIDEDHAIVLDHTENGTILADKTIAKAGEIVTLKVIPDTGYQLKTDSLKMNGQVIQGLTFEMPNEDVTITAEFTKIPEPTTPPESSDNTPSYDDGGPFIKDVCGNVFDRWDNKIYSAPACVVSGGYQVPNTGVR